MPPMGGMGFGPHSGRQPLTAEEKANQPKVTKELLVRVMSWLTPYKLQLAASLGCIICSSVLTLMPSILTGKIIDEGAGGDLCREHDRRGGELPEFLDRTAYHL